jgi:hypothetical protein
MTKATVEVLVDDFDGSEAVESVRLGWNGEWRELELSEKNLAALSKAVDKYWNVARPVTANGTTQRRRRTRNSTATRSGSGTRDPKAIRVWAEDNGIPIPSRGRIPGDIEQRYNKATGRS